MTVNRRRLMAAAGGAAVAAAVPAAFAQAFPSRPITIVVPYPPGASTEQVARLVQQRMSQDISQPVIVESRPGANGNIGAAYVAKSPPDGYRILLATQPIVTINPYVYRNIGFDPNKELTPLTKAVNAVVVIFVHPSLPVHTVAELIAYGKANPNKLSHGSAGSGTPQHIGGVLFAQRAGFEWTHIPYKGGGPMVNDVVGGQIQAGIVTYSTVKNLAEQGRVRIIAIGERTRFAGAPNIPTIAETLPGFELTTWLGFFGPGGLPADVQQYLSRHIMAAVNDATVKGRLQDLALPVDAEGPQALARLITAEQQVYQRIVRANNITAE